MLSLPRSSPVFPGCHPGLAANRVVHRPRWISSSSLTCQDRWPPPSPTLTLPPHHPTFGQGATSVKELDRQAHEANNGIFAVADRSAASGTSRDIDVSNTSIRAYRAYGSIYQHPGSGCTPIMEVVSTLLPIDIDSPFQIFGIWRLPVQLISTSFRLKLTSSPPISHFKRHKTHIPT